MDDDFFDLPDEGQEESSPTNKLLSSGLFGEIRKPVISKIATFDNILASLPKTSTTPNSTTTKTTTTPKKPVVTFQNPLPTPLAQSSPRNLSTETKSKPISSLNDSSKSNFDSHSAEAEVLRPKFSSENLSKLPAATTSIAAAAAKRESTSSTAMQNSSLLDSLFSSKPGTTKSNSAEEGGGSFTGSLSRRAKTTPVQESSDDSFRPQRNALNNSSQRPAELLQNPTIPLQMPTANYEAIIASKNRELEEAKRELSALRYEKAEDQRTIGDLRRKLETMLEEHQRMLNSLSQDHKKELNELQRRHELDIEVHRDESANSREILNNIKNQEIFLKRAENGVEKFGVALGALSDKIAATGAREEDVARIVDFAKAQIQQNVERFEAEKAEWTRQRENVSADAQNQLAKLSDNYQSEIIEGRRWIESQRELIYAERMAFQEEQMAILDLIEKKKEELNAEKSNFLSREHDLLIRVVNEKAIVEQQQRDFERQRNADVARLRDEAEHLETCLIQVENARNALHKARRDYEHKNKQLNEVKTMLVEYEENRLKRK